LKKETKEWGGKKFSGMMRRHEQRNGSEKKGKKKRKNSRKVWREKKSGAN